jgi:hypothetical protein
MNVVVNHPQLLLLGNPVSWVFGRLAPVKGEAQQFGGSIVGLRCLTAKLQRLKAISYEEYTHKLVFLFISCVVKIVT